MSLDALSAAERTFSSHDQRRRPLGRRLRRAEIAGGLLYALAVVGLAALDGVGDFSLGTALVYLLALGVASNVRFDVGAGFTVPIQAVFVPMLFALPLPIVPVVTALGLTVGMLPDVLRGRIAPSWLLTAPNNCWFCFGPALVLALADDGSPDGRYAILVAALAAQFAVDFAAAAIRDHLFEDRAPLAELAREVAPIYAIDVSLSFVGLLVALATTAGYGEWPVLAIGPLFGLLWFFSQERQERLRQLVELNDAYQGTALLLGDVVESDDSYTGSHSKGVVLLSLEVARRLGLGSEQLRNVEFGALLHDVGKLAIPNEIINKRGTLNRREREIIETHTVEGEEMLARIGGFMVEIGRIVRASHEDYDGGGYPDGLAGEEIPLEARIVAACDAINAMTTTRSYRRAMPLPAALRELRRCAGSQFDPTVVETLVAIAGEREGLVSGDPGAEPDPAAELPGAEGEGMPPARRVPEGNGRTLSALAELAVTVGANLQPGQPLEVSCEVGHLETARAVVEAAYRHGASFVDVQIQDPMMQRSRVSSAGAALDLLPDWEGERVRELVRRGGASVLLVGPSYPGLLDDLDPLRVARASRGPSAEWREAARQLNWTVVPAATDGWASRLRPELPRDEALAALWADLARVCRLDCADPVAAWRRRLGELRDEAERISALELSALRFVGAGTDLTVGLVAGGRWDCAEMEARGGISFVPNLPTEEIFTSPDPARVDGTLTVAGPVSIGGREVAGAVLRFSRGRVVAVGGPPEAEALREFISRDGGAARLGEVALVDARSRTAELGQAFGEILLDENAGCHVALGYGFPGLIPESSGRAANSSDHHLDLTLDPNVDVIGIEPGGGRRRLLAAGVYGEALTSAGPGPNTAAGGIRSAAV